MAKAAIEGLTLSLRREATPFGITAMTVQACGSRTDLAGRSLVQPETPIADYVETAGGRRTAISTVAQTSTVRRGRDELTTIDQP